MADARAGELGNGVVTAGSPWILVLDAGSSSVRVRLYDREGGELDPGPGAQRFYGWRTRSDGEMEIPADELVRLSLEVIDAGIARARRSNLEIAAVAVTTFWHSLLGLAADGVPLTPLFSWGDTRAARTALRLRERVDETAMHRRTGCFLHPSYPAVKLVWLRARDPDAFARCAAWVSFAEYLERLLFGEGRCSFSMASGTGLLDVRTLEWDPEMLRLAGVNSGSLSRLVDLRDPAYGLRPEFARRWPELAGVPWYPALGDGACANVGSGAVGADRLGVTLGTSSAVRALWEPAGELTVPDSLWCYRLDAKRCVTGGALSNGGNAFAYLQRTLQLGSAAEWESALAALGPDEHGLTVLPYLVGERSPEWLHEMQASVVGLTQGTRPVHVLRAWMEAVAFRIARTQRRLEEALGEPARIHASGGALHESPVWSQVLADVLNRSLTLTVEREASSRGAALVVQEQLGWLSDLRDAPMHPGTVFHPDAARHEMYGAAMRRQSELETALAPWLANHGQPFHAPT